MNIPRIDPTDAKVGGDDDYGKIGRGAGPWWSSLSAVIRPALAGAKRWNTASGWHKLGRQQGLYVRWQTGMYISMRA